MNKWEQEPDRKEWVDPATGLTCLVLRQKALGTLCGYVRIPEEHVLFGRMYNSPDYAGSNLRVHGGITYSGPLGTEKGYWFGFDCAHAGDYIPGMRFHAGNETYRDMEYVTAECESLASQVAEMKEYT